MAAPRVQLPKHVTDALDGGNVIEAIKRLRKTGLGLAEAKSALEAYAQSRRDAPPPPAGFAAPAADHGRVLPAPVLEALQRGDKMAAVRLLRERTGLGKNEATKRVEAAGVTAVSPATPRHEMPGIQPPLQPRAGGLAPGEVPRSNAGLLVVLLAAGALVAYYLLS